jgi:hypothetical protein
MGISAVPGGLAEWQLLTLVVWKRVLLRIGSP